MYVNRGYPASHVTQLRVKPDTWAWLLRKSAEAQLPPSTYARKRLEELAHVDLQKDTQDGQD